MWFESISAKGFGPLKNARLELGPGFTVVYGLNESGKSSWHAALYAGFCGLRRGQGVSREDKQFRERHSPWDGGCWDVTVRVHLADGRRVDIHQDLDSGVNCGAVDADLGLSRDYSTEIIGKGSGSPDGALWLGLDRRSFLATACVRQSQLLAVTEDAKELQELIQRAVDTAGTDETAAVALERINQVRREQVGSSQRNAVGPLRKALDAVDRALDGLVQEQTDHAAYLELVAEADRLRQEAEEADHTWRLFRARVAVQEADEAAALAERARALAQTLPVPLVGDPPPPQQVRTAHEAWMLAETVLNAHDNARPTAISGPLVSADAAELWRLATALGEADPVLDQAAAERLVAAQARVQHVAQSKRSHLLALGGALLALLGAGTVAGSAAALLGSAVPFALTFLRDVHLLIAGLVLVGAGLGLVRLAWLAAGQARSARQRTQEELRLAEQDVAMDQAQLTAVQQRRDVAQRRCTELGLAPLTEVVRQAAEQSALAQEHARVLERWSAEARALRERRAATAADLAAALPAYGIAVPNTDSTTLRTAWSAYVNARQVQVQLEVLLGGRTVGTCQQQAVRLAQEAISHTQHLDRRELAAFHLEGDVRVQELRLQHAAIDAATRLHQVRGQLAERTRGTTLSVADAEEELARAQDALARVKRLDHILTQTAAFLDHAQQEVHRDASRFLAAGIRPWLPQVTAGRYVEAAVDPQTLDVSVRTPEGTLRRAGLLSHGTAEQIYLLLRATLAARLTKKGEVCPLVLDDVTVHCDAQRRRAVLQVLRTLSRERQVLLFTQEREVLAWAEQQPAAAQDQDAAALRVIHLVAPAPA